jgi:hypothetical protein
MCRACVDAGTVCDQCSLAQQTAAEFARQARESRTAMRRAGIPVKRELGDPVVLWEGPFRLALPVTGAVLTAIGAGVAAATIEVQWGVDVALTVVGLATLVGMAVRLLFGGVSRPAGFSAAAVCAVTGVLGRWFAGDGHVSSSVMVLGRASEWLLGHGGAVLACYAVAVVLAYAAAAGRRVA